MKEYPEYERALAGATFCQIPDKSGAWLTAADESVAAGLSGVCARTMDEKDSAAINKTPGAKIFFRMASPFANPSSRR